MRTPKPLVLNPAHEADRRLIALRLKAEHEQDVIRRRQEAAREMREKGHLRAEKAKQAAVEAQRLYRARKSGDAEPHKPQPLDARFTKFKANDLVQLTLVGLQRQRNSSVPKTEKTSGVYVGRGSNKGKGYANVDWYADDPWPHKQRQLVQIDYLEPLGTPR